MLSLTHLAESLFATMANENRMPFLSVCGLTEFANLDYVASVSDFAFCEGTLDRFGGRAFDGASRVDVVVRLRAGAAAAFELKLGETRLAKTRVDEEWLRPCEPSHDGRRWRGNMMAILDRRFLGPVPQDLFVTTTRDKVVLERDWFVVARQGTLDSWKTSPPNFGPHVRQVSFENVVHKLGGKDAFNGLVRRELEMDFYEDWIAAARGTG
jgi:hypothetical protein